MMEELTQPTPHYPVGVLLEDIMRVFHSLDDGVTFQRAIDTGLKSEIRLKISDHPITDCAGLNSIGKISIEENFCQFYWCLCYSTLVLYDEGIIRPSMDEQFDGRLDMNNETLKTAYEVFKAGVGLLFNEDQQITSRHVFFDLPNPYNLRSDYVDKASSIFMYGISFILYHELSHFIMEHSASGSLEDEKEADASAYWASYFNISSDLKITAYTGIITILCALVFMDDTMKGDEVHPDGDDRINEIMDNLDESFDHYWGIACCCLKMWGYHYNLESSFPTPHESESWKDYFNHILLCLKEYKQQNSSDIS